MALKQTLTQIDAFASELALLPPASDDDIAGLSDVILARTGLGMPEELGELYRWHNGQSRGHTTLPDANWRFLSIAEVLEDWSFFHDPLSEFQRPYKPSWLPIIGSGSSNYQMYELDSGRLTFYWHDSTGRGKAHASLSDWAQEVLRARSATSATGKAQVGLVATHPPETLVLSIEPNVQAKDLSLVRDVQKLSGLPLPIVAKALSPSSAGALLEFPLSAAVDRIDRSSRVRAARKVLDHLIGKGLRPNLYASDSAGAREAAAIGDLVALEHRCLSG